MNFRVFLGCVTVWFFYLFASLWVFRHIPVIPRIDGEVYLVTSCSFNRIDFLQSATSDWDGPLKIAVAYVALDHGNVISRLEQLKRHPQTSFSFRRLENETELYPVNELRNAAIRLVPFGSAMLLVDADQYVSAGSYSALKAYIELQERFPKTAIVLPAFELGNNSYDTDILRTVKIPRTKAELNALRAGGLTRGFKMSYWPVGHSCSDYDRWWSSFEQPPYVAPCWAYDYEPYFSVLRTNSFPMFDEQFKGWGGNRVSQIVHSFISGYRFLVEPQHFVIHLPHPAEREKPEIALYHKKTNVKLLNNFYSQMHAEWQKTLDLDAPFNALALYSFNTSLCGKKNALQFDCGDIIDVKSLIVNFSENGSFWYGRRLRDQKFGIFPRLLVSLAPSTQAWCSEAASPPLQARKQIKELCGQKPSRG